MGDLKSIGVTPQKAQQFEKRGIFSTEDLVAYLPTKYRDFSKITGILSEAETSCLVVKTRQISANSGSRIPYVAVDGTLQTGEEVRIVWFHQQYRYRTLLPQMGMTFFVAGKVKKDGDPRYNRYSIISPELFEPLSADARRIYPVYRKIPGMSMDYLTEKISQALSMPDATAEILPADVVQGNNLLSRKEALYYLHRPKTQAQITQGQRRILYDDLLYFALHNEWAKRRAVPVSSAMILETEKMEAARASLGYTLTPDQQSTLDHIIADAKANRRVNALVQGDVGCGKTIIAILAMIAMAENGYQSVIMAPTQVVARQHYEALVAVTAPLGLKAAFLGSDMPKRERAATLRAIEAGEVDIIAGTHSVISPDVKYHKLALTVADEEHKFGVNQRAALVAEAAEGVHAISMSATPIPRTLAQVIYGQTIQLYTIETMPEGRKPVITGISTTRSKIYKFILREAKLGHQTYVVCPLIDPSDNMEGVKSVENVKAEYDAALAPYGIRVAMLTGRDKKSTTEETMRALKAGEIDVLVATTIVEVGVNVPTASLMVISNAERFGLASLHQLRGRVGRSDIQSYCVLDCGPNISETAQRRLAAMCRTTDGFVIAQEDLNIRGAGDFLGTRQSGSNKYLTLTMAYPQEYQTAQAIAQYMVRQDARCPLMAQVKAEQAEAEKTA